MVELGVGLTEASGDGLSVDLGGPLPVGAVEVGRVGVTAAARGAAARAALSDAAGGDVAEIGEFGCQLAVTTLVAG